MTEQDKRKTLGLGKKKLGLKISKNDLVKGTKEKKVIVVTKGKASSEAKKHDSDSKNPVLGSLTEKEMSNRMDALSNAQKLKDSAQFEEEVLGDILHKKDVEQLPENFHNKKNKTSSTSDPYVRQEREKVQSEDSKNLKKKKQLEQEKKELKKVSISKVLELEEEVDDEVKEEKASIVKRRRSGKSTSKKYEKLYRQVVVSGDISVRNLALRMSEKLNLVLKTLINLGLKASKDSILDIDSAELVIRELGHTILRADSERLSDKLLEEQKRAAKSSVAFRPPIVTFMGHVDHGKTSLLDSLRSTDVVKGESGGITQHIGAYTVKLKNGNAITFLDTPGHEAFTAMRVRGAEVTDIVVIVVAADDGVKEQTIEAINHAKAANVTIIVAINKIDKSSANADKVKQDLFNYELVPEDMGGDIMVVPVSAKEKKGLDALEDAILLQAEFLELKANYAKKAEGFVIESRVDKHRGPVASFIVKDGVLNIADIVIVGEQYFKVRALLDDSGHNVKKVLPSYAAEVLGLNKSVFSGESFFVVNDEKAAKKILDLKKTSSNEKIDNKKMSIDDLFHNSSEEKIINLIIKADVHGSLEAVRNGLEKMSNDSVRVKIVHAVVGAVAESDINLAKTTKSMILAFNLVSSKKITNTAQLLGVELRGYSVIYDLFNDVQSMVKGLMPVVKSMKVLGYAKVRQVFNIGAKGKVAGCMVSDGVVRNKAFAKLSRDSKIIYEGRLSALKRFKDDVKEVRQGFECGISFEKYNDIKEGDLIEVCEEVVEK